MNELETAPNWNAMKEQAAMLVKSGFLPPSLNTPEKAIAVALTAKELGIGMMEGFRSINVIQGKPTIPPQLMLALANRTGQVKDIKYETNDQGCKVTVTRSGREPHTEEFGIKEATALGLIGRDNYKKQPAVMFRWRALAGALRVTFPDAVLGFYTPDEMGAEVKTSEAGEMEVLSQDEMVNTGIRVPAGYWDLPTLEKKQARIGEGNRAQKTDKGWFIFSPKTAVNDFLDSMAVKEEISAQTEAETPLQPIHNAIAFISHDEQLELFKKIKERGIHHLTFKKALKNEFGVDGSAKITKEMYPKVWEWIIKHDSAGVGI